jgi:hypothetical protein
MYHESERIVVHGNYNDKYWILGGCVKTYQVVNSYRPLGRIIWIFKSNELWEETNYGYWYSQHPSYQHYKTYKYVWTGGSTHYSMSLEWISGLQPFLLVFPTDQWYFPSYKVIIWYSKDIVVPNNWPIILLCTLANRRQTDHPWPKL